MIRSDFLRATLAALAAYFLPDISEPAEAWVYDNRDTVVFSSIGGDTTVTYAVLYDLDKGAPYYAFTGDSNTGVIWNSSDLKVEFGCGGVLEVT